jgi:pyridoxal phosphate enzyme (YggS family)
MDIAANIAALRKIIPAHVRIVAVSKNQPPETIMEAYRAGIRKFGENKAQEFCSKYPSLPMDIEWHFIGHLQRNKVKQIIPFVRMIHSIDSLGLLIEVDKEARKINRMIRCLLQFHIAEEETKFGIDLQEAVNLLESKEFGECRNVVLCGVMGMATLTGNTDQIRSEFRSLYGFFGHLKQHFFQGNPCFCEISMGMTGDFRVAIEEGSTMVRIGTAIFGERNYGKEL